MKKGFTKLFEPGQIGSMKLKNRIVMPPMGTLLASPDQSITDYYINYHARRAKGGVGMQILGVVSVDPLGQPLPCVPGLFHDKFIPGMARLADAIHEYDGKVCAQLHHAGSATYSSVIGAQSVSASPIPTIVTGEMPRELTTAEVEGLAEAFGKAAARAKKAGLDAVEVHGAHGYLITQFLSPLSNRRTDKYGGDFSGRMRFALDIVKSIREHTGHTFPIIFRLSGTEFLDGGLTLEDTKLIAQNLVEAGVDAIHVSAGNFYQLGAPYFTIAPMYIQHGPIVYLAEEIKAAVNVPVIAVGSITPEMGEDILQEGKAHFISMGRALIADPDLPNKLKEGKVEEINRCIRCNDGCISSVFMFKHLSCTVNPTVGREKECEITPAEKIKKVMVVGGGPAGMKAAHVAGLRGHNVVLYEKATLLGGSGQLKLAMAMLHKDELRNIVDYHTSQLNKLNNVKIVLGKKVDAALVEEEKPDVVIIATGGTANIPNIKGIHNPNVVLAGDVIERKVTVGTNVVVAGGGLVGSELANMLASGGKRVTIVELLDEIAADIESISRGILLGELEQNSVEILTKTKIIEFNNHGLVAVDADQNIREIKADTVIVALGAVSENALYERLKNKVPECYLVGDAKATGKIMDAISNGFNVAIKI